MFRYGGGIQMVEVNRKNADVLVIGGGQSALRAAIEARKQGAHVAIVTKGRAGFGGSSAISDGVHSQIFAEGDSPELFYEDMMKAGGGLGHSQVMRKIAEECSERVQELKEMFHVEIRQETEVATPGQSFPRRVYAEGGKGAPIVKKLRSFADEIGVEFYDHYQAIDLIQGQSRVMGAIFKGKKDILIFQAGSTILSTGGFGSLYDNSDNPRDVTGEGLAMAWRHGAQLENLEFIQFYPYRLIHPVNIDVYTKIFGKGAVMRNKEGVRFMDSFSRKELETRDVLAHEMNKQGTVYLDISEVSMEVLEKASPSLYRLLKKGYSGELIMSPVEHYSLGGIQIDEYGRTNVAGLYACGECTSIHGVDRLGGGALTDGLVIGARAGYMANLEKNMSNIDTFPEIDAFYHDPEAFDSDWKSEEFASVRMELKQIMWKYVGIERTTTGLEKAVEELSQLSQIWGNRHSLSSKVMSDLIKVAYFATLAASKRKESRGAHRLADIPEQKHEWNGKLIINGDHCDFQPKEEVRSV